MSVPKLVILADDLTGAADSAARCFRVGVSAEIWMEGLPRPTLADAVAISTDSRFLPPEHAAQRVTEMLEGLASWRESLWYKKIDSTLRGNLGSELDAMLAAMPNRVALICPAFPAQGRGLEGGNLVFASAPARHLPTLLREQSPSLIGEIHLEIVRKGAAALQTEVEKMSSRGTTMIVVDALTDGDLDTIVAVTQQPGYLLCGSAGMVAPLAALLSGERRVASPEAVVESGSLLTIVGSGCEMAHAQIGEVATTRSMRIRMLDNHGYEMDLTGAQSHPSGDWLLHLPKPTQSVVLEGPTARVEAARLADVAYAVVERLQPTTLIVVGGDTANYVLRRLGVKQLSVAEELMPGIALTFGVDRTGRRRTFVLKPGNFGDTQTLVTLQQAIHQRHQPDDSNVQKQIATT